MCVLLFHLFYCIKKILTPKFKPRVTLTLPSGLLNQEGRWHVTCDLLTSLFLSSMEVVKFLSSRTCALLHILTWEPHGRARQAAFLH
jgi:hypothetical protein